MGVCGSDRSKWPTRITKNETHHIIPKAQTKIKKIQL